MITSISISNFKGISHMVMDLGTINVLVGSNSAGKSSVSQAILFAVSASQALATAKIRWQGDSCAMSIAPTELVYLPTDDISALATNRKFTEKAVDAIRISFTEDADSEEDKAIATVDIRKGRGQYIQCKLVGNEVGRKLQSVQRPYAIYVPGISGMVHKEERKPSITLRRLAARGDSNLILRNVLLFLKAQHPNRWRDFQRDLNIFVPNAVIDVKGSQTDEYLRATIARNGVTLPLENGGTGILQLVQLLAYFHLWRPSLLVLDEPDAHLHPDNQVRLANAIERLCGTYHAQALITTHSRYLLEAFEGSAKVHWLKDHALVEYDDNNVVNALLDIGALNQSDVLVSGRKKALILTEDSLNKHYLEHILISSGYKLSDCEIWPYKGCTKLEVIEAIAGFTSKYRPELQIVVHRDRDYLYDEDLVRYTRDLSDISNNLSCWIPPGTSIEYPFTTLDFLREMYPAVHVSRLEAMRNEAFDAVYESSLEKFINSRTEVETRAARKVGSCINSGQLARDCRQKYLANPDRFAHAKKLRAALVSILHKNELRSSSRPFHGLASLEMPELKSIADRIYASSG